jgi:flagellar hook-length control protein FliK
MPDAALPASDRALSLLADANAAASNQSTGTNGTAAAETPTLETSTAELPTAVSSPAQAATASVEALPTLPSAATLAQTAAVAAPLASVGLTASQRAQNGMLPAESSRASSLSNAFDIPTTVSYTPAPSATSSLGSGSTGSNPQGGAGFGSSNNRAAGSQTPPPSANATAGIVTQDLALLTQSVALEAEAAAPSPVIEAAATSEDTAPVETKAVSSQTGSSAQTSATRGGFEVPTSHQGTSAGRPNQVLLPLTSQIATGIVKLGQEGGGEITMRLQPANLGRVDVSMKFDDGRMTAMITADRQDTLDLLRRDAYGLERSLADAGLKMDGGGLEFSLRGDGGQRDRDDDTGRGSRTAAQIPAETELAPANPTRRTSGLSRLDMRI